MRFDEASAWYAEFGPFYVGLQFSAGGAAPIPRGGGAGASGRAPRRATDARRRPCRPALRSHFADYAAFHRTRATRPATTLGIPLIVLTLFALLARVPLATVGGFTVTLAEVVDRSSSTVYYLTLDVTLALVMLAAYAVFDVVGRVVPPCLALGLFVLGWILQFVGHYVYEKKSPAFFRNFVHLSSVRSGSWPRPRAGPEAGSASPRPRLSPLALGGCGGDSLSPRPPPRPSRGPAAPATPVAGTPPLTTHERRRAGSTARSTCRPPPATARALRRGAARPHPYRASGGRWSAAPFLDITDAHQLRGGEQGLLGLAFHPRYAENGRFFVNYTDRDGDTHIAEFRAAAGADAADPATERTLLVVRTSRSPTTTAAARLRPRRLPLRRPRATAAPAATRWATGRTSAPSSARCCASTWTGASPTRFPPTTRSSARAGARPEIWAFGLRNPWRFAFDRATGDLYIGDVGQGARRGDRRRSLRRAPAARTTAGTSSRARTASARARLHHGRPHAARRRVRPRRGLLGHRRRRLPRLPHARLRRDVLLRRLLLRLRPLVPAPGGAGHRAPRLVQLPGARPERPQLLRHRRGGEVYIVDRPARSTRSSRRAEGDPLADRPSKGELPAVDHERLAVDERRVVRRQERVGRGDLLGRARRGPAGSSPARKRATTPRSSMASYRGVRIFPGQRRSRGCRAARARRPSSASGADTPPFEAL